MPDLSAEPSEIAVAWPAESTSVLLALFSDGHIGNLAEWDRPRLAFAGDPHVKGCTVGA